MDFIDMKNEVRKGDISVTNPRPVLRPAGGYGQRCPRDRRRLAMGRGGAAATVLAKCSWSPDKPPNCFTGSGQQDTYRAARSLAPLPDDRSIGTIHHEACRPDSSDPMLYNLMWIVTVVVMALLHTTGRTFRPFRRQAGSLAHPRRISRSPRARSAPCSPAPRRIYQDVASKAVLGRNVLCLVIAGYAAGRLSTRLVTAHPAVKAGLVFLAGLAQGFLFTCIRYVQYPDTPVIESLLTVVVPASFYTALITPFVFFALDRAFGNRAAQQGAAP